MMQIRFLSAELVFTALWLTLRIACRIRRGRIDWKREAALLLMYVNLAVLLRFTFFPLERVGGRVQPLLLDPARIYPFRINPIPFVLLLDYPSKREILFNLLGNVAMFIPSGIILPLLYRRLNSFLRVTAAGALLSLCAELLQLPFAERASDVDDLILNTLGVALGYGIYAGVRKLRQRRAAGADADGGGR